MNTRLTRFLTRTKVATPAYLVLIIIINISFALYGHLPRTRLRVELGPYARYLGVKNYLNNYFAMYTRLMRFLIRVEVSSLPSWG